MTFIQEPQVPEYNQEALEHDLALEKQKLPPIPSYTEAGLSQLKTVDSSYIPKSNELACLFVNFNIHYIFWTVREIKYGIFYYTAISTEK